MGHSQCGETRQGIALIVVLGFLSIMLMMAVAFLTQARVERLVAGASMEGMRTRQMAQTAIAAGMQDYLNAVKEVSPASPLHRIFLSGDLPAPKSFHYSGEFLDNDRLAIGKVEDWLLDWHKDDTLEGGVAGDQVQDAEWIWIREEPGKRSRILGRYAYACFDMSGLIDANLLGTAFGDDIPKYGAFTNRNNVRKMVFDAVSPTPKTGGDRQYKLNIHQRIWKGFDSPAALLNLTDGLWNDGRNSGPNRWEGADMEEGAGINPSMLSSYSYSVLHKEDGSGKQKVRCTAAELEAQPEFSRILAGASKADVIKALEDYESTAVTPQGVDYPSVKNVPMFNEIGIQLELDVGPIYVDSGTGSNTANYTLILRMKPEFWYPFPSEDNKRSEIFTMATPSIGCGGGVSGVGDIWARVALGPPGTATTGVRAGGGVTVDPSTALEVEATFGNPYFARNATAGNIEFRVLLEPTGSDPLPPGMNLFVRSVRLNNALKLQYSGGDVDATPGSGFGMILEDEIADGETTVWVSMAVSDPRLNHNEDEWKEEDPHTLGAVNQVALDAMSKVTGIPPGDYVYCRNGPIEYPGELGYLSNGQPWGTLDIFSEDGIQLMNRLICNADIFNIVKTWGAFFTNGTINPNTRYTNVLNAAFYGLDMRDVPGMDGEPDDDERLSAGDIDPLVKAILADPKKLTTGINEQAGWARALTSSALPSDLNKNNRIAIFNNTWGLFNESDRLFVIVVVAQSIKEGEATAGIGNWDPDDDMITGERRAVALCWIDSSADVGGETLAQELNIIAFQYLNE
ncbi:MAG: hypothetical protein PHO14_03350 [Kiritimatiellae bacterium]|nr:hypothetical protein [Kiritimatiellia bacterium]